MKKVYSINQTTQNGNAVCYLGEGERPAQQPPEYTAAASIKGITEKTTISSNKRDKIFIVHGHDEKTKLALKDYLQNILHLPEPVILSDVAARGRTIMECFEEESEDAGIVFVLLTPDDFTDSHSARARQNVIFELGYFIGRLGRKSGRVIVLEKDEVEIPSDLSGILYIKIDHGIKAAGEDIRKAIEAVR